MDFCYLKISSFAGYAIGAKHYYGTLLFNNKDYELSRKLTEYERKKLNLNDGHFSYRKGSSTYRFNNKKEIIKVAKELWKKKFPKAMCLVLGSEGIAQPQKIIDGYEKIVKSVNKLYNDSLKCKGWENNKVMEKICKKWEKIVYSDT